MTDKYDQAVRDGLAAEMAAYDRQHFGLETQGERPARATNRAWKARQDERLEAMGRVMAGRSDIEPDTPKPAWFDVEEPS